MRRLTLPCLIVAIAAGLASCITPSIPIPPPDPEAMDFDVDLELGAASFRYDRPYAHYADAIVYVWNRDAESGVIVRANADGTVDPTPPFPAEVDDRIAITFETAAGLLSTCVILRAGRPDGRDCW
jgi:hypothetical protein